MKNQKWFYKIINRDNIKIFLELVIGVGVIFSIYLGCHGLKIENLHFRPFIATDNEIKENKGYLSLMVSNNGLIQAENITIDMLTVPDNNSCYDTLQPAKEICNPKSVGRFVFTGNFESSLELSPPDVFVEPEHDESWLISEVVTTSEPFMIELIGWRVKNFGVLNPNNKIILKIWVSDIELENIKNNNLIFVLSVSYEYNKGNSSVVHYSFFRYNRDEHTFFMTRQEEVEK